MKKTRSSRTSLSSTTCRLTYQQRWASSYCSRRNLSICNCSTFLAASPAASSSTTNSRWCLVVSKILKRRCSIWSSTLFWISVAIGKLLRPTWCTTLLTTSCQIQSLNTCNWSVATIQSSFKLATRCLGASNRQLMRSRSSFRQIQLSPKRYQVSHHMRQRTRVSRCLGTS